MPGTQKRYSFKRKSLPCNTIIYRPLGLHLHCTVTTDSLSPGRRPNPGNGHIHGPSCRLAGSHRCWEKHVLWADVSGCSTGMTFPVTAWSKGGIDFRLTNVDFHIPCQKLQRDGTPISSSPSWSASGYHAPIVEHITLIPLQQNSLNQKASVIVMSAYSVKPPHHLIDLGKAHTTEGMHLRKAHT